MNDAPLLKALLFLLYEDIFRGASFGPKDKDNVQLCGSPHRGCDEEPFIGG